MAIIFATKNTLLGHLQQQTRSSQMTNILVFALLGTVVLTISARINIPFVTVPATFQTLVVAVLSAAFGWRLGVLTVLLYLTEGALGLPVFANGGGTAYMLGPTGGFLVGFLPAAFAIGKLSDMGLSRKLLPMFGVMLLGDLILSGFGFFWLLIVSNGASWIDQSNVLGSVFDVAFKRFIIWDLLKMALAAVTVVGAWQLVDSIKK